MGYSSRMSLVKNLTESERIQKVKDRAVYANYLINQTKFQQGCNPNPTEIQSGSGSSNQASLVTDIRLGARYTTPEERDAGATVCTGRLAERFILAD